MLSVQDVHTGDAIATVKVSPGVHFALHKGLCWFLD